MTRTVGRSVTHLRPGDLVWFDSRAKRVESVRILDENPNGYVRRRAITFTDGTVRDVRAYATVLVVPVAPMGEELS